MKRPSPPKPSPRPSRRERLRRARAPLGVGTALGAFALLCGLVLIFSGAGLECGGPNLAAPSATTAQVLGALETARSARSALQGQNYGEARRALQELQNTLEVLLSRLDPKAAPNPSSPAPGPPPEATGSSPTP